MQIVAAECARALLGVQIGLAGMQVQTGHRSWGPEHFRFDALVASAAQVIEAVVGTVVFDLVAEIHQPAYGIGSARQRGTQQGGVHLHTS